MNRILNYLKENEKKATLLSLAIVIFALSVHRVTNHDIIIIVLIPFLILNVYYILNSFLKAFFKNQTQINKNGKV